MEFLREMGIEQKSVVMEQDNKSAITLAQKGPSGQGRTKWLNVKYFWVEEHIEQGAVVLKYVPSLEMLSDGFTKPLPREQFFAWRARVLNMSRRV